MVLDVEQSPARIWKRKDRTLTRCQPAEKLNTHRDSDDAAGLNDDVSPLWLGRWKKLGESQGWSSFWKRKARSLLDNDHNPNHNPQGEHNSPWPCYLASDGRLQLHLVLEAVQGPKCRPSFLSSDFASRGRHQFVKHLLPRDHPRAIDSWRQQCEFA